MKRKGLFLPTVAISGTEKRKEFEGVKAYWHIAEIPSKLKALKQHPRTNKVQLKAEYLKASIRAKVEHPFRIIKYQFGFTKACYRGLKKNDGKNAIYFGEHRAGRSDVESIGQIRLLAGKSAARR